MKYLSDFLKIVVFVLLMYLPLSIWTMKSSLDAIESDNNLKALANYYRVRDTVKSYLVQKNIVLACQQLETELNSKNIVMYSIISPEGSCYYPDIMKTIPDIGKKNMLVPMKVSNLILQMHISDDQGIDWAFAVLPPTKVSTFSALINSEIIREGILKDLVLVIYIVFAFVFFAVLILTKTIQNQYFLKIKKQPWWLRFINATFGRLQLHDLRIVKSATDALVKQNENLIKDLDLLETSLEYSILNEIKKNNKDIPYTFKGAVAKVDINGFSKVIQSGHGQVTQYLTQTLEDFGCELLQRYGGLFEKSIGDEIVVVFKNDESELFATAFARDLMREFSQVEFALNDEKRQFTLKGAISISELTFSKRTAGYGFTGNALTFTTRLMDAVKIKDRNVLSCLQTESNFLLPLINLPDQVSTFEFKNMSSVQGYFIDRFKAIDEIYSHQPAHLKFFRSDDDFIFLLKKIVVEPDTDRIKQIIQCFLNCRTRVISTALLQQWQQSIVQFSDRVVREKSLYFEFSEFIMCSTKLIPQKQWNEGCTQTLLEINRDLDGRINASIVDVLMDKNNSAAILDSEKSFIIENDNSFRTRGNLLVNQACLQLEENHFEKLIAMINSKNQLESSTGIYSACAIIQFYQRTNPVALELFSNYKKLLKLLRRKRLSSTLSQRLEHAIDRSEIINFN